MKELISKVAFAVTKGNKRDQDLAWDDVKSTYKKLTINFNQYMIFKRSFDRVGYFN